MYTNAKFDGQALACNAPPVVRNLCNRRRCRYKSGKFHIDVVLRVPALQLGKRIAKTILPSASTPNRPSWNRRTISAVTTPPTTSATRTLSHRRPSIQKTNKTTTPVPPPLQTSTPSTAKAPAAAGKNASGAQNVLQ